MRRLLLIAILFLLVCGMGLAIVSPDLMDSKSDSAQPPMAMTLRQCDQEVFNAEAAGEISGREANALFSSCARKYGGS